MVGILSGYSRRNCSQSLGGEPPGGRTQRDRGPSTWLSSSMARSSTCPPMATPGLVDGSSPPRSWVEMAAGEESQPSLLATATHRHRPPSHIFYTSLQSPMWLKNSDSGEENKHIDGLWKTMKGMGTAQWTLTGVKPPWLGRIFSLFRFAAVFQIPPSRFVG